MDVVSSMLEQINNQVSDKKIVAIFLGDLLKRQYPKGLHAVTPAKCLKWPLWPTYLKIHNSFEYKSPTNHRHFQVDSCSEHEPGFLKWVVPSSDEDKLHMMCSHAVAVIEEVYSKIVSGQVTITELCKMEEQKQQLMKLCKAASSGNVQLCLSVGTLLLNMEKHKSEYDRLMYRVRQLTVLFSRVAPYLKIERKLSTSLFSYTLSILNLLYLHIQAVSI